jgi:hypothetical protein
MIELKLKCSSCGYERIIDEREFIMDLQQCPNCSSDNIEIVQTGDSPQEKVIVPTERDSQLLPYSEQMERRRFVNIFVIGLVLLLCGIGLYMVTGVFLLYDLYFIIFSLAVIFAVIGVILIVIAVSWWTS